MSTLTSSDHATTDRISESAHESVDQIAKTAGKAEKRIRHGASDAELHMREAGTKARECSEKTVQSVSVFVRDKPWTSLGIAFAAGTLLSVLKRRS